MKLKKLKKGKKKAYKSRYQAGGMYGSNTVSSAGQGNVGNTSSIVYQESNPAILEEKLKAKKANEQLLMQQSSDMTAKIEQMDAQSEIDIQTAANKVKAKDQATSSVIKSGLELGKAAGVFKGTKTAGSSIKDAIKAYKTVRTANQAAKGYQAAKNTMAGIKTAKNLKTGFDVAKSSANVANIAKTGIQTGQTVQGLNLAKTAATTGRTVGSAASTGSAIGSAASALNNVNVYAAAANYAGKGIKSIYDDDDATTWTAGEGTGDVLSKAGEYAGYGAMLGSVVPGVGNLVGGVVGGIAGVGVGLYQGLTGRKKARKAEADALALKKKKVGKYNEKLGKSFASQKARVNAAQLAQKTYSGYDLGQNVVARKGGMRMGMPRYGYAA